MGSHYDDDSLAGGDRRLTPTDAAARAFTFNLMAARQGEPLSMLLVGSKLNLGLGVGEDHEAAVAWWLKIVQQKQSDWTHATNPINHQTVLPRALSLLGQAYHQSRGVGEDLPVAASYYKKAAQLGDTTSMINVSQA